MIHLFTCPRIQGYNIFLGYTRSSTHQHKTYAMSQRSLSMLSTVSRVRRGLDNLFDKVMELRGYVPTDGHVNFHNLKCVEHVIRFDFEQLDNPQTCSTIFPPVSFRPMESTQLRKSYPEIRGFANIDQFIGKLSPKVRCSQIASLIHDRATREVMIHQGLHLFSTLLANNITPWQTSCFC